MSELRFRLLDGGMVIKDDVDDALIQRLREAFQDPGLRLIVLDQAIDRQGARRRQVWIPVANLADVEVR